MNYTQKALGILFGVILLLVLFWLFIYSPVSSELDRLQEQAKEIDGKIAATREKHAGLPGVQDKIASARKRLERLEVQYPRTIELVYQAITDASREVGLRISNRQLEEKPVEDEGSALREYAIQITAHCPYNVLGDFLGRVVHSPMIISFTSLTVSTDPANPPRKKGGRDLRVDMKLITYLSKADGS